MATQFDEFQKVSKEQLEHAAAAAATLTRGFQTIATETTDYSKRSLESTSSFIEKLFTAKTLESAIQIQTEFAKSQLEGFVAQATKLSELYKELAKEAIKPVETAFAQAKGSIQQ
jgi:phasin family protein